MDDVQERKLMRHFELLDFDHNGYIEQDDIVAFAEKITEAAGAEGSPQSMALHKEGDKLWQQLQARLDADGDMRISRDEFISAADLDVITKGAIKFGVATFDVTDTDQDGRISLAEWIRMDQKLGVAKADSQKGFQKIDKDGDGFVTKAEYAKGVEEFYLSDDESAPGNWAFGKF